MQIDDVLIKLGSAVALLTAFVSIILEILRQIKDSKAEKKQQTLQEKQFSIEDKRFQAVDLVRAAMDNINQYRDLDDKVRQQFRAEIDGFQERYNLLAADYASYREESRNTGRMVGETLDSIEADLIGCSEMCADASKMNSILKKINQLRRDVDV